MESKYYLADVRLHGDGGDIVTLADIIDSIRNVIKSRGVLDGNEVDEIIKQVLNEKSENRTLEVTVRQVTAIKGAKK